MRPFSEQALSRLIRTADTTRFDIDLKSDKEELLSAASEACRSGKLALTEFRKLDIKGKSCVCYDKFNEHLALRSISRYLVHKFKVKPPSRDAIVKGVIEALTDGTPMSITRRDIRSFYETVPLSTLREKLAFDAAIPGQIRAYLRSFFDVHCSKGVGIPRGVGLSAVLAEISMQSFDNQAKGLDGVYRYFRFADDIIVFSTVDATLVDSQLHKILPDGMDFNRRKVQLLTLDSTEIRDAQRCAFEYLGYRFETQPSKRRGGRRIRLSISQRKINKHKSRVLLSFKAFLRNGDYNLLRDRLRFAAGNYVVRRKGFAFSGGVTHVKSGIFYNYRYCGTYCHVAGELSFEEYDSRELEQLDALMRTMLLRRKGKIANQVSARLTEKQTADLLKVSFVAGYHKRMTVRFNSERIALVKRVWRNV